MVTSVLDQTVLVTGVGVPSGIGAAIARSFAQRGARLGLHFLETKPAFLTSLPGRSTGTSRSTRVPPPF